MNACKSIALVAIATLTVPVAGLPHNSAPSSSCSVGACTFYNCIEDQVHCGPSGYPIGYGLKYCDKFMNRLSQFSTDGKHWVIWTRDCLQRVLNDYVDVHASKTISCAALQHAAMSSHVGCYTEQGASICDLSLHDWAEVVITIHEAFGDAFLQTVLQSVLTAVECLRQWREAIENVVATTIHRFHWPWSTASRRRRDDGSDAGSALVSETDVDYQSQADMLSSAVEEARQQVAAYLGLPARNIFVDVQQTDSGKAVYVDGPSHPVTKQEDAVSMNNTKRFIDLEIRVVSADGKASQMAEQVVDAVHTGKLDKVHLLSRKHAGDDSDGSDGDSDGQSAHKHITHVYSAQCHDISCATLHNIAAGARPQGQNPGSPSSRGSRLSSGSIAGIVVGSIIGAAILCVLIVVIARANGYTLAKYQTLDSALSDQLLADSQKEAEASTPHKQGGVAVSSAQA